MGTATIKLEKMLCNTAGDYVRGKRGQESFFLTADIWQDTGGVGTITAASWGGDAFTKASSTRSGGMASEIWYLIATSTGARK